MSLMKALVPLLGLLAGVMALACTNGAAEWDRTVGSRSGWLAGGKGKTTKYSDGSRPRSIPCG